MVLSHSLFFFTWTWRLALLGPAGYACSRCEGRGLLVCGVSA